MVNFPRLSWYKMLTELSIFQSLNSPFFPPGIGAEHGRAKRVQDNQHAHAQNEPIKNYQVPTFSTDDTRVKQVVCVLPQLIEENGYETRQSSLLYVIVLFSGLDPAQNTIVVYSVPRNQPIAMCWLRNHAQCMSVKQKIVQGRGPSNINLGIFVCSFDVWRAS